MYSNSFSEHETEADLEEDEGPIRDIRFIGAGKGCYTLASRTEAAGDGSVQVFACRVQSISTKVAILSVPVQGEIGEFLTAKFDDFNVLTGQIVRKFEGGLAMEFIVTDKVRREVAAKIKWLKKSQSRSVSDQRAQKRQLVPNPRSTISFPDGRIVECLVIDVSRSGVAVSGDVHPELGTRLAIGKAKGRVVRQLEVGFAVEFDTTLDLKDVDKVFKWVKPKVDIGMK